MPGSTSGGFYTRADTWQKPNKPIAKRCKACGNDPLLLYNLGVLLDDMDRLIPAMEAYEAALTADPDLADGHYNLALLFEKLEKPKDAIRHMARYRALVSAGSK